MNKAICIPHKDRPHTDHCNDCTRRADSRRTERPLWQWVPVFKDVCPSKIKETKK